MSLQALREGTDLWPQRTGLADPGGQILSTTSRLIMAVASSVVGYNFWVVLRNGWAG